MEKEARGIDPLVSGGSKMFEKLRTVIRSHITCFRIIVVALLVVLIASVQADCQMRLHIARTDLVADTVSQMPIMLDNIRYDVENPSSGAGAERIYDVKWSYLLSCYRRWYDLNMIGKTYPVGLQLAHVISVVESGDEQKKELLRFLDEAEAIVTDPEGTFEFDEFETLFQTICRIEELDT